MKYKGVKSEKIEIKTWFCDKDLSSLDSKKIKKRTRENIWNITRKYIWNIYIYIYIYIRNIH